MFGFKPVRAQLRQLQKESVVLKNDVEQNRADLEFVAIMADVEIPEEEEAEDYE